MHFRLRQIFHRKFRNRGCSFTTDLIGAVASCCFLHPSLSLASEQTLNDLKRSQGHQRGGEESGFGQTRPSGLHRNSPQGLNISSIKVFDQIRDPEIPINLRPLYSVIRTEYKKDWFWLKKNHSLLSRGWIKKQLQRITGCLYMALIHGEMLSTAKLVNESTLS